MRKKLETLYSKYQKQFSEINQNFKSRNIHGPFLMSPEEEYKNAAKKLMIIGQETNGWSTTDIISTQMSAYREFGLGSTYNSPFWNVTRKLEVALNIDRCTSAWTNINKYDENQSRPKKNVRDEIEKLDPILIEEIKILKPEVIVFFVGPRYHNRLLSVFTGLEFITIKDWKRNALCRLKHPSLSENTFVTYHPAYLRRSGLEADFIKYFNNL